MYKELLRYVFPKELFESFDPVNIEEKGDKLHMYLDEKNIVPEEYGALSLFPNGFYEASTLKDFPPCATGKQRFRFVVTAGRIIPVTAVPADGIWPPKERVIQKNLRFF